MKVTFSRSSSSCQYTFCSRGRGGAAHSTWKVVTSSPLPGTSSTEVKYSLTGSVMIIGMPSTSETIAPSGASGST